VVGNGLFERAGELVCIDARLCAARAGRGSVLLIAGPAGIGKTSLMAATVDRALGTGMRVLSGRGGELEGEFSFGVARQLFEPLLAEAWPAKRRELLAGASRQALIALNGADGAVPTAASDALFAAVHGLYWLAVNAAGIEPLLVAVDDLHWADQGSMRFVSYLAARLQGLPVALVLSWRMGEAGAAADFGARVEAAASDNVLRPAALSEKGVLGVLEAAFHPVPAEAERLAAACHAVTGGNPFLLRELIRSLKADGIRPGDEAARWVTRLGPRPVAQSVASRAARLGHSAGEVARAAAILGEGAHLRHAAALAGITVADAAAAADSLARIGVLEVGIPLRFVHPIVRTALYDDIPQADRGLRHTAAARLLAAEGADVEQVCAHLLACPPDGSGEVVQRLRDAAVRALARGAAESAIAYLRRALAETLDTGLRAGLLHELGRAEMVLRDPAATQHLREALGLATDPTRRAEVAADLAQMLLLDGQWAAGAAVVQAALGDVSADDRGHDAAGSRLSAWWAGFAGYDPLRVTRLDSALEHLLTAAGGEGAGSRLLAGVLADKLILRAEQIERARDLLDHALDKRHLSECVSSDAVLISQAMFAAIFLDQVPRAEKLADWLLTLSRSHGSVVGVSIAACVRATIEVRRGDLVAAETDIREVADIAAAHGLTFAVPQVLYWGADALIERPGLADLAGLATATERGGELSRTVFGAMLSEVRGRLALAEGNFMAAQAALSHAADIYRAIRFVNPNLSCWRSTSALAIAGQDRVEAQRLIDDELADARRLGLAIPAGIALRTRGILTGGERGPNDLREAAAMLASTSARLEEARALVELGAALRRCRQRAAAREPLRIGLDLAHRCGATRLAQRAFDELQVTGARPRRTVITGLAALTPSERRTAELAASGLSNPEIAQALFVTLNTVEGHLRHTYKKLSISSRGQLPTALASVVAETHLPPDGLE
jgi:DNA-binding CsgD family transcriptional regulator